MKKIDYISKKMIKRMEEMKANNETEFRKKEILEVANSSFVTANPTQHSTKE